MTLLDLLGLISINDKGRGSKNERAEPSDYSTGVTPGKRDGKEE